MKIKKGDKLSIELPTQEKLLHDIEYPLVHVLARVEQNGAKIDKNKLSKHSKELSKKIDELSSQAFRIAGEEFNLDSPKQLLEILWKHKVVKIKKRKTFMPRVSCLNLPR